MPYTEEQKKEHIRELRTMLYGISLCNSGIPCVLPYGSYDSETRMAVEAFQREYGLPVTGDTDSATWNRIASVYRNCLDVAPAAYHVFPSRSFSTAEGDSGELVYIIQAMLGKAAEWYDNMPKVSVCGEFNDSTAAAVRTFQGFCGLDKSGCVDCATWNMLVHFLEAKG